MITFTQLKQFTFNSAYTENSVSKAEWWYTKWHKKINIFLSCSSNGEKLCRGLLNVLPLHSSQNIYESIYAVASWSILHKEVFDICILETLFECD